MSELRQAVERYRALGWPAFTHGTLVWMTPGIVAEALNMSRPIGERVLAALGEDVPVYEIPAAPARWVFLARPHPGPVHPIEDLIAGHDIGYAHGRRMPVSAWGIDLPPARHAGQPPLRWVTSPDLPLPAIITIARLVGRL